MSAKIDNLGQLLGKIGHLDHAATTYPRIFPTFHRMDLIIVRPIIVAVVVNNKNSDQ